MEEVISMINGQNVAPWIEKGLTNLFTVEQAAKDFAIESRSYYYAAKKIEKKKESIVFCVPK